MILPSLPVPALSRADALPPDPPVHQPPAPPQGRGWSTQLWGAPQLHGVHPQGTPELQAAATQPDGRVCQGAFTGLEGEGVLKGEGSLPGGRH